MVLPDISQDRPGDGDQDMPTVGEKLAREQAIRQIGRSRQFRFWALLGTLVWVLTTAGYAWFAHGNKPVPESKVKREMERQAGQRR